MGSTDASMTEPQWIEASFACPNDECGQIVDALVEPAFYDPTTDKVSDGVGYSRTTVECQECQTQYQVEVTADATGQMMKIDGFSSINIAFTDIPQHEPD